MSTMSLTLVPKKSTLASMVQRGGCGNSQGHGRPSSVPSSMFVGTVDCDNLCCEHCGHSCHTKEQCWDCYRKPQRSAFGGGRGSLSQPTGGSRSSAYVATPM